jgi:uncharacterized protein YndB with AHSA1/START domain
MTEPIAPDSYGVLSEPATLTIQRLLPGPIERVWAYLTESDLRRQWLAAGPMPQQTGAPFELTWRNDELSGTPGQRPDGFAAEHSMQSEITEIEPLKKLAFTWQGSGDVCIELDDQGDSVLLTLTHQRLPNRNTTVMVSAGWHAHLDVLLARLEGCERPPFWATWEKLKASYEERLAT